MALDHETIEDARARLAVHLGRNPLEGVTLADVHELLYQPTPDELRLDALTYLHRLREDLDQAERGLTEALRDSEEREPVSWTRIGRAQGMTRQGGEGRYLRLLSFGQRKVAQGRQRLAHKAQTTAELRRLSRARWGRYAAAERTWVVRLRARTHAGEELELLAQGPPGQLPRLSSWRTGDYRFLGNEEIAEVLQVLQETTPWADVQAPESLAGLPGDH